MNDNVGSGAESLRCINLNGKELKWTKSIQITDAGDTAPG